MLLPLIAKIAIVCALEFFLNIPFGFWRQRYKRLIFMWFLAVHLPVPIVVFMRYAFEIGYVWWSYPFMLTAYILGQHYGANLRKKNPSLISIVFGRKEK